MKILNGGFLIGMGKYLICLLECMKLKILNEFFGIKNRVDWVVILNWILVKLI